MQTFNCTTAELLTPEFTRLLALAAAKENQRLAKLKAARRALSICGKLKPSPFKARNSARVLTFMNKLRAAA